jgi:hypothetical protein
MVRETVAGESPNRLRKKYLPRDSLTPAAKASAENKPVTAALKRCATQNQERNLVFPQPAKAPMRRMQY